MDVYSSFFLAYLVCLDSECWIVQVSMHKLISEVERICIIQVRFNQPTFNGTLKG